MALQCGRVDMAVYSGSEGARQSREQAEDQQGQAIGCVLGVGSSKEPNTSDGTTSEHACSHSDPARTRHRSQANVASQSAPWDTPPVRAKGGLQTVAQQSILLQGR
eukprot:4419336-Pyramimonas_sp.AAC.1